MNVYAAFLRGVNVGGKNIVKMADLRVHLESLGFSNVQTYVQSGNIVFATEDTDRAAVSARLTNAIEAKFGVRSEAVLRTADELRAIVAAYPCAGRDEVLPNRFGVMFLSGEPIEELPSVVSDIKADPEEVWPCPRDIYLFFPNGQADTKFSISGVEKLAKRIVTFRNWNTVNKVLEMTEKL